MAERVRPSSRARYCATSASSRAPVVGAVPASTDSATSSPSSTPYISKVSQTSWRVGFNDVTGTVLSLALSGPGSGRLPSPGRPEFQLAHAGGWRDRAAPAVFRVTSRRSGVWTSAWRCDPRGRRLAYSRRSRGGSPPSRLLMGPMSATRAGLTRHHDEQPRPRRLLSRRGIATCSSLSPGLKLPSRCSRSTLSAPKAERSPAGGGPPTYRLSPGGTCKSSASGGRSSRRRT